MANGVKCEIPGCVREGEIYILSIKNNSCIEEKDLCEAHALQCAPLSEWSSKAAGAAGRTNWGSDSAFELRYGVLFPTRGYTAKYFLAELNGSRRVEMESGYFELAAVRAAVRKEQMTRPWTFAGWLMVIEALGGRLEDVYVDRYDEDGTYHARLRVRQADRLISVDLRPSDAFALAIVGQVSIRFAESVLARVAG